MWSNETKEKGKEEEEKIKLNPALLNKVRGCFLKKGDDRCLYSE